MSSKEALEIDPMTAAIFAGAAPLIKQLTDLGSLQIKIGELHLQRELRIAERELAAETLAGPEEAPASSRLEELEMELACLRVEAEMARLRKDMKASSLADIRTSAGLTAS